jgi:glycosyltransferase involved in cell wall biosynthesis
VAVVNWRDPWHSLAGGSERYAWEFARALHDAGGSVDFLTARDAHQRPREVQDGIRVERRGRQFSFYFWIWLTLLRRRLTGRGYDVVIDAENGIPVFAPLVVGRRTAVVLVMHHVHQAQFLTYFPAPLAQVGRFLEGRVMPLVYRNVRTLVVSESTHREMVRQLGWRKAVQVVANGTDLPPATTGDDADPDPAPRLLVFGRLATHKRVDLVLRAVAQLATELPELRVDVVGKGPEEERLRALVDELGLHDVVVLHGFLPEAEKQEVLHRSRLQVCASDAEGWGQVVIEAATYGVPTLARDVPGLQDSIRPGRTGWLVPDAGPAPDAVVQSLVVGIRTALAELESADERERYADACRDWGARFSWTRMRETVTGVVMEELARVQSPDSARHPGAGELGPDP